MKYLPLALIIFGLGLFGFLADELLEIACPPVKK